MVCVNLTWHKTKKKRKYGRRGERNRQKEKKRGRRKKEKEKERKKRKTMENLLKKRDYLLKTCQESEYRSYH